MKYIATLNINHYIHDKSKLKENIRFLIRNGIRDFRVNYNNCDETIFIDYIDYIITMTGKKANIIIDLPYPQKKSRILLRSYDPVEILKNQKITFCSEKIKNNTPDYYQVTSSKIGLALSEGDVLIYGNGQGAFLIDKIISENSIMVSALNDFLIHPNKSINLLEYHPVFLTKSFIEKLEKRMLSTFMLSFVEKTEDILRFKSKFNNPNSINILSKIETDKGLHNLDAIISNSKKIVIARGDLALYTDYLKFYETQKFIIERCHSRNKEVIIATDILSSLSSNFIPNRADLIDFSFIIQHGINEIVLNSGLYKKNDDHIFKVLNALVKERK